MMTSIQVKFLQQQILTIIGILGVISSVVYSIITNDWIILLVSFLYSQIIVSLVASQIGLHRYFSHRSFTVNRIIHWFLYIVSILPGQGSPVGWAAAHRHHHKYSDKELDNHSPSESYWLAAGGWLLKGYQWIVVRKKLKTIPTDLLRDRSLAWLDHHYYTIWWLMIIAFLAINFKFFLFFLIAPIGWTLLISALVTLGCHLKLPFSYRNFNTDDNTHNNLLLQAIVLGDALHNNHHYQPNNNLKVRSYEFDLANLIIDLIKNK
jgi:fatty-acid desaturase